MSKILDYLKEEKEKWVPVVNLFMEKQIGHYGQLTAEYLELLNDLRDYLIRGGKWQRPTLGLLAYELSGGKRPDFVRQALIASEMVHRYLLIHDDIIDQDLTRHGAATIEKLYQNRFKERYPQKQDVIYSKGMAIVAGDIVNTLVYESILDVGLEPKVTLAVIKAFNQLVIETAAGWQLQTEQNYQEINQVTEENFFTGMQLVSCQYSVVWPLRVGQILAGRLAQEDWDKNLDEFGWHAGAAFQITDDIIGMFGDEETTGKPVGHDFREGKKTYLVLKTYQKANQSDREFLVNKLGTKLTEEEYSRVRAIMIETGALEYSQKLASEHVEQALSALSKVKTESVEARDLLADFANFLLQRRY